MHYDLNVPYSVGQIELQRTLAFLVDLGYNAVALDHSITGKVAPDIRNQIPDPLPFTPPASLKIIRRCTLHLSDTSQNHRLSALAATYDVFAIRPTTESALQQAGQSLECDLISLDMSQRFPFHFRPKMFSTALQRGLKFEICYAPGILNADGGASRRNLISNTTQLIRATRGRGLIISSEAKKALACRGPADLVNLAVMWGLAQDRAVEAITREARDVIVQSEMKRRSFRGVVDVINGGLAPVNLPATETIAKIKLGQGKRKAKDMELHAPEATEPLKISKREQKRQAKKARLDVVHEIQKTEKGSNDTLKSMKTIEPG